MLEVTSKLEIDALQASDLVPAIELAAKHKLPAVIVHPGLVGEAEMIRLRRRGQFKLIVPVDWPKGEVFSTGKLRGLTATQLSADGFEFLLTGGKNEAETHNEAVALTNFVRDHISKTTEVRFVLGVRMRTEEEVLTMARALVNVPQPVVIRTDHHLKAQITKGSAEAQGAMAGKIRQIIQFPIKASGNFNSAQMVAACGWAHRIAVSPAQAQTIIGELAQHPQSLREMLN